MPLAKILIVEDDPTIAIDIRLNLEAGGYEIVGTIHTAEKALDLLACRSVDLILLDINLDGSMSGIELAKIIDERYRIPFIYLSSYSDEATLEKAAHTFPASYLVKPFKENDLVPAIKIALSNYRAQPNKRIPHIDLINKELLSKITIAEYKVLQSICQAKNNQEIADELFITKNTLKSHIKKMYSKLGIGSRSQLIKYVMSIK